MSQTKAQTQTPFLTFALILSLVFSQVFGLVFGASVAFAQVSGEGLAPTSLPVVSSPAVPVPDSSSSSPSAPYVAPVPDSPAPIPTPPAYIPPPTSSPADSLPSNPPPPSPLPITIDGSTNTQVTKTASGIDQVNIATPNGSGISMNRFVDYNINSSGQIINNFSGNVALDNSASYAIPGAGYSGEIFGSGSSALIGTQIGGLVVANPNLISSSAARLIINQVTSSNDSKLLGYAEIAGRNADLIIANPNGITCAGCGFINTSRLSLIAGKSFIDPN